MSEGLRLISAIIATGSGNTLTRLDREIFTIQEQATFDFVSGFFRQYREMPTAATVNQETNVRLPIAQQTMDFYLDQVQDRHIYNQIIERYAELRDSMRDRDIAGMRPIVEEMSRAMRVNNDRNASVMGIGAAMQLVTDRLIATRGTGGITGIETPWATFNEITGGYQDADLVTIVGRPGVAKTYNLLTQAMAAHDSGESVLVVSTEMGIEQLARRYAALRIGINPEMLKKNTVSSYMMRRIEQLGAEMISDETFRILSVGMHAKVSTIEALLQEMGPDACYVDGTYLLHPSIKTQMKRIERVAEVFDELKGLTISANIPIINTMQFNRQAGKDGKDGSLENIGFTDAVGMHSSLVIGLAYGPTENPRASRTMSFLKGREGETGQVHMNFKFAPVDMSELAPDQVTNADGEAVPAGAVDVDWMA